MSGCPGRVRWSWILFLSQLVPSVVRVAEQSKILKSICELIRGNGRILVIIATKDLKIPVPELSMKDIFIWEFLIITKKRINNIRFLKGFNLHDFLLTAVWCPMIQYVYLCYSCRLYLRVQSVERLQDPKQMLQST